MASNWRTPTRWRPTTAPSHQHTPFKSSVKVVGYRPGVVPLVRHPDGRLFFTNTVNLQTMDRDGLNPTQVWSSSGSEWWGFTVYQALILPTGTMLLRLTNWSGSSVILRSDDTTYTAFTPVLRDLSGELMYQGWSANPDGVVLLGEYPTTNVQTVRVWRADDDGRDWSIIHTFRGRGADAPAIFHTHCTTYDPFGGLWWINTGDLNPNEPGIYTSDGRTLTKIGGGSQFYRTVSFAFDENYAYWSLDGVVGGSSYFMRYDKARGVVEEGMPIPGAYMFINERLRDFDPPLYLADGGRPGESNTVYLSPDAWSYYPAFTWEAKPGATAYNQWNAYLDAGGGRIFAYTTSQLRHDSGAPFDNTTVVIDISS